MCRVLSDNSYLCADPLASKTSRSTRCTINALIRRGFALGTSQGVKSSLNRDQIGGTQEQLVMANIYGQNFLELE